MCDSTFHRCGDLVALRCGHERSERHALLVAGAESHRRHLLDQLVGELFGNPGLHQKAVRRGACLAAIAHLREERALDSLVDVGVVEYDEWCVAAELHRRTLHPLSGL